jgi:hypothetical protein
MSSYIENLQQSIEQHQRQIAAGDPASQQAQEIINQHLAEIQRVQNSAPPPAPTPSGGSPSYSPPPPPPPPTPPNPWVTNRTYTPPPGVKQADPDIVLDPEISTTGDFIVERFFEELGGTELISISRHDLIDGINVVYNPIANLSRLRQRFNPNNIISLDVLSQDEFARATINLISRGIYEPYFDNDGNLVVEIDIMKPEENIDTEISESGTVTRIEL